MAPLPPVTDVIKVQLGWGIGANDSAESVLHFLYSGGPPSGADCAALAAAIQGYAKTELLDLLNDECSIQYVTVTDLNSDTGKQGVGGTPATGTRSGSYVPAQTCFVVNHTQGRRYRGGKPRTYIPGSVTADLEGPGLWTSTIASSVTTDWGAFLTSCLSATSGSTVIEQFGCVSYVLNKVPRTTPVFEEITSSVCRQRIGTQRRRAKKA